MPRLTDKQDISLYANARIARDARFDGVFFIAVKTTGIYCRPICPANTPLEKNIEYHASAISAAEAGFRPCLRCRPDSAPQSNAWLGTDTSFNRAIELIHQGQLQEGSVESLANRLGISDRYLRELFQQKLGTSPKKYAVYQQCLFAKQLLHESDLSITDIAFASGFNSIRRFNEAMKQQLGLAPRDIRKSDKSGRGGITLKLSYRPPYAWPQLFGFLQSRVIQGLEWGDERHYGRTIEHGGAKGYFEIEAQPQSNCFSLSLQLDRYTELNPITQRLRALFDVDAPIAMIDEQLQRVLGGDFNYCPGLRVPGIWNSFEAGIRAILGQQISVAAARNLVTTITHELGSPADYEGTPASHFFPVPEVVASSNLSFFKMPQSRKDTIRRFAEYFITTREPDDIDAWVDIKGVGPWTVNYVKMRAGKDPDIWLAGDASLRNALKTVEHAPDLEEARPWRSYLTLQLWNQL